MITLLAIGIPVFVGVAFAWFHAATDRRNRRSMRRYGSALDRLGDVSRRSDAVAPVRLPSPDAIARPHIGIETSGAAWTEQAAQPRRANLSPPQTLAGPSGKLPLFDDVVPSTGESSTSMDQGTTAAALARMVARSRSAHEISAPTTPPRHPVDTESVRLRRLSAPTLQFSDLEADSDEDGFDATSRLAAGFRPRRGRLPVVLPPPPGVARKRRMLLATIIFVAVTATAVALGVGLSRGNSPSASTTSTTLVPGSTGRHPVTTTLPNVLVPISVTSKLVVYRVPTVSYVVRFSATAPCWLGSQASTGGPYLWMDTLSAGTSTTYSAKGTRFIRVGAPKVLAVSVNGIPVELPRGNAQPYNIKLETAH